MKGISVLIGLLAGLSFITAFHVAVENKYTSKYCIIMDAEANGTITYKTTENKTETFNFTITPTNGTYGRCFNETHETNTESVDLKFYPNNIQLKNNETWPWILRIVFEKDPEKKNNAYIIKKYNLYAVFYRQHFPNAMKKRDTYTMDNKTEHEWHGEKNLGYTCSKSELSLKNNSKIVFEHLKLVAFGQFDSIEFPKPQKFKDCKSHIYTSHLALIIVGIFLLLTVIIVGIAYVVHRARANHQEYPSI